MTAALRAALGTTAGRTVLAILLVLAAAAGIHRHGYAAGRDSVAIDQVRAELAAAQRDRDAAIAANEEAEQQMLGLAEAARWNAEVIDALREDASAGACRADGDDVRRLLELR